MLQYLSAHAGAALALIGASYSGCDTTLTIFLLTLAVALNGAAFAGFGVNHVDIAANHAGVLMGITNTIANVSGFVAPYVAGLLINGNSTLGRWQIVFYIAAAVYILDTIIYVFFSSSDEQPWNREVVVPRLQTGSTDNLVTSEDIQQHAVTSDEEAVLVDNRNSN
ncbi:unnamed protein product [Orchesella dallaii]|uniref:Inorganic phosphate cotransporter n=1 Tax=Orchesella dallaii TaxID=48710 RepID=A0ABP1PS31_9HEXA